MLKLGANLIAFSILFVALYMLKRNLALFSSYSSISSISSTPFTLPIKKFPIIAAIIPTITATKQAFGNVKFKCKFFNPLKTIASVNTKKTQKIRYGAIFFVDFKGCELK